MKRRIKRKVWAAGKHGPVIWIKVQEKKTPPQIEGTKEQRRHLRSILEG